MNGVWWSASAWRVTSRSSLTTTVKGYSIGGHAALSAFGGYNIACARCAANGIRVGSAARRFASVARVALHFVVMIGLEGDLGSSAPVCVPTVLIRGLEAR